MQTGFSSERHSNAPSTRVLALMIIVTATVVAVIVFRNAPGDERSLFATNERVDRETINETDTDGDGLMDWEEDLWGFSSVNPDTDSDGIGDKDEVDDRRALFAETPEMILDADGASTTPTGIAGRILLSQYLVSKQTGVPLDEDAIRTAVDLSLAQTSVERSYVTHSMSELTVSETSDATALRAYGNAIGDALMNKTSTSSMHELYAIFSFTQSGDADELAAQLDPVLARYQISIDGFLAVTVPDTLAETHLSIINAMERVKKDLADMATIGNDPFTAVSALQAYGTDSQTMTGLFTALRKRLADSGVTYAPNEPGYAFMNATKQP